MFEIGNSQFVAQHGPLDTMHEENIASMGLQNLINRINLSEKWHQTAIETARFATLQFLEKSHYI